MGENSKIEWCQATFNHVIGCTKVAAGCTHCYAETFAKRTGKAKWGPQGTRVKTSESYWKQPLKWNREAEAAGERRRVFCASMSDVFEEWDGPIWDHHDNRIAVNGGGAIFHVTAAWQPLWKERLVTLDDVRDELFKLTDATPHLDWLMLTKRPENILRMWPSADIFDQNSKHKAYWPNVWLGTSIATQADAIRDIPLLRECRDLAPVLFLSVEPLLEAVELDLRGIDWVIVGGESGPHARRCDFAWIASIVEQCKAAGVPVFVKQLGARPTFEGRGWKFEDKKGGDIHAWPQALQIRQFPEAAKAAI